ncbi:MAG: PEP-utilizing enzyme [Anaeroplasma bactoclasticum]|nr:PEP-utilizing enzyme [Anaeroplasma bactoclasticum]
MVFFKRYIVLFFEILLLYTACLASALFEVPFFTETLYVFLPFFYLIRALDDILDYNIDLKNNRAPLGKGILYPLAILFFLCTVALICIFQLWYLFILFILVIPFCLFKRVSIFAKMLLLPTVYSLFLYYNYTFEAVNICMLVLFFVLSTFYALYKKLSEVPFYDEYKEVKSIGGKAYNLDYANVKHTPAYFIVPKEFFKDLEKDKRIEERLKKKINSFCKKNELYAVRSSAIDEDSFKFSFAGIHNTKLNVLKENVFAAIFEVYQSAFTPLALEYRKTNLLPTQDISMAVVVQKMIVEPQYSGVIFTINPKTDNPDELMISIIDGLGEDLVNGKKDSMDYFVSENYIKGDTSFISIKLLKKLKNLAHRLQKKYDAFLDIEFTIKKNKIYFLQARPITTYADIRPSQRTLLIDNSNLIESYYGTTSYLTQSFAKSIYQGVYTKTLEAGHVRKKVMNSLKPTLENMLYAYEGKLYYNLNSWYQLTSIFPIKSSTSYMEQMMGVESCTKAYKKVKLNLIDMIKIGLCFVHRLHTMEKASNSFIEKFNRVVFPFYGHPLSGTNEELIDLYQQIEDDILSDFATPILNDCAVMFYNGRLIKKIKKKYKDQYTEIFASCIHSSGTMESARVCKEYNELLKCILENEDLSKDFKNMSPEELYHTYYSKDLEISKKIKEYILHFGSRVMNELKLETTTLIEDPVLLYKQIQEGLAYISQEPNEETPLVEIPKNIRHLADKTRYYIVNRERLRLKRTYIFSVVRNIFLAIGRNLESEGKISYSKDIFYLTKTEVFSLPENVGEIIRMRKKEMADFSKQPYYYRISFYPNRVLPLKQSSKKEELRGLSNGKTIIKGKVSLMKEVTDPFTPGDIIVASRTDPGWISLFPLASGLIVEHGSMLSHSFVVARELGLPAIVGIPNITKLLKTGDVVTLDSVQGVVRIEK